MTAITIPGLQILDVAEMPHVYQVCAQATPAPLSCPYCRAADPLRFGTMTNQCTDLPRHGKAVVIRLLRQRYRCRQCRRTFLEPVAPVDARHRATTRLIAYIQRAALTRTFAAVASEVGLDERTVRRIFQGHLAEVERALRFETPRWLGLGSITVTVPRCIVGNVAERTAIAILPDCEAETVARYLQHLPRNRRITHVMAEPWEPYRFAVCRALPGARLMVDARHATRLARECLEMARKGVQGGLPERRRRALMHDRELFRMSKRDLDPAQRARLAVWARDAPMLVRAYECAEAFDVLWSDAAPRDAIARYFDWQTSLDPAVSAVFTPVLRLVSTWRDEIAASLDHPSVRDYTDCLDGLASATPHLDRGYSFEAARARLLYAAAVQNHQAHEDATPMVGAGTNEHPPDPLDEQTSRGADIVALTAAIERGDL